MLECAGTVCHVGSASRNLTFQSRPFGGRRLRKRRRLPSPFCKAISATFRCAKRFDCSGLVSHGAHRARPACASYRIPGSGTESRPKRGQGGVIHSKHSDAALSSLRLAFPYRDGRKMRQRCRIWELPFTIPPWATHAPTLHRKLFSRDTS